MRSAMSAHGLIGKGLVVTVLVAVGVIALQGGNSEHAVAVPVVSVLQDETPQKGDEPPDTPPFAPPSPRSASERVDERHRMVREQLAGRVFGRDPVRDESVLDAMRAVPRHRFVPSEFRREAYLDTPLPIGAGQTISQPYMVGLMTELLTLSPESKVLEIGTGSGYQAAVLAHLTPHVYTVEIIKELAGHSQGTLHEEGYDHVQCRHGDGYFGWETHAPYDAIIVTCAAGHLPPPLWEQLRPGGRIVIPIGGPYEVQRLVLLTKQPDGTRRSRTITEVRFVPLTRAEAP